MPAYSDLARIFTTAFIRHLLSDNHQSFTRELSKSFPFVQKTIANEDYRSLFQQGYNILLKNYRCEYIYKSEIYSFIKSKSKIQRKDGILTEVRSGQSVADMLWLNGTSIAYEIKTEIDNNRRLLTQVNSYSKLFKQVIVVSYENNFEVIARELPQYVGIVILDKKGKIKECRESIEYIDNLDPEIMFMTLRRNEYENVIKKAFGEVPDVSDAYIYKECMKLFTSLPPLIAHDHMVEELKKRGKINIDNVKTKWPKPIRLLLERGGLKRTEIVRLERRLN